MKLFFSRLPLSLIFAVDLTASLLLITVVLVAAAARVQQGNVRSATIALLLLFIALSVFLILNISLRPSIQAHHELNVHDGARDNDLP